MNTRPTLNINSIASKIKVMINKPRPALRDIIKPRGFEKIWARTISAPVTATWYQVEPNGKGLPNEPGVYRFRVPMEANPEEAIEFLALMRWRKHGVHSLLSPTFEYLVDDESFTVPEGTYWRPREASDPSMLSSREFLITAEMEDGLKPCPFCKSIPIISGDKISKEDGSHYHTNAPYRFNRFWLNCCEWVAPASRPTIGKLKQAWGRGR